MPSFGCTSPAPYPNGFACEPESFWIGLPLVSLSVAVVIIADLIAIGDQVGCLLFSTAAIPAMCGVDIDVPLMNAYSPPAALNAVVAASTLVPGAMMSGLSRSPFPAGDGPRLEELATFGALTRTAVPGLIVAVGLVVPLTYALTAGAALSSRWTVGTECRSESSVPGVMLSRIMPTPPAFFTCRLLSTRAFPPRSQTTILPVAFAGSSVPAWQRARLAGSALGRPASLARTTGVCGVPEPMPAPV